MLPSRIRSNKGMGGFFLGAKFNYTYNGQQRWRNAALCVVRVICRLCIWSSRRQHVSLLVLVYVKFNTSPCICITNSILERIYPFTRREYDDNFPCSCAFHSHLVNWMILLWDLKSKMISRDFQCCISPRPMSAGQCTSNPTNQCNLIEREHMPSR